MTSLACVPGSWSDQVAFFIRLLWFQTLFWGKLGVKTSQMETAIHCRASNAHTHMFMQSFNHTLSIAWSTSGCWMKPQFGWLWVHVYFGTGNHVLLLFFFFLIRSITSREIVRVIIQGAELEISLKRLFEKHFHIRAMGRGPTQTAGAQEPKLCML